MARLGINIDAVAGLRDLGCKKEADPVKGAVYAEIGGCDGIVCTVRKQLRPVTERDLKMLREIITTHFNIHVPAEDKPLNTALSARPDMITLFLDSQDTASNKHGVDILGHQDQITATVESIRAQDIAVSVLIEPEILQVKAAAKAGADYVELILHSYTLSRSLNERADSLENLTMIATAASKLGMGVSASQGLNFSNIHDIAAIDKIEEVNIGAAIIGRSLWIGMEAAVRDMVGYVK